VIDGSAFTWVTNILLLTSAVISLIGGIMAFNRRKVGGIFLVTAALICLLAHSSTRLYGVIYLVAGALAFLVRSSSGHYEEENNGLEEDSEYDYNADEAEEEEREREIFGARSGGGNREEAREFSYGGRRKERASRIRLDREEYSLSGESVPKFGEPLRIRSSKVCPACGASVGVEHKFCHTCGSPLQGAGITNAGSAGLAADTPPQHQESPSAFRDFQMVSPMDSGEPAKDDVLRRFVDKSDDTAEEENPHEETLEDAVPHRVFVRSSRKDATEPQYPYAVDPDDSYKEFSDYTRRRKRRRSSLTRRILGPLVLLLAVSGAAWLLLGGMRTVPKPEQPPVIVTITEPEPVVIMPEPTIWERIQIEDPTRGVVTGTNVNVRQTHSINGQIVARLNAGARADILGRWVGVSGALSGPWFNIRTEGRDGWIYGLYFQPMDGRPATLPRGYTEALLKSFGSNRPELISQLGLPTRQTPTSMTWAGLTMELRGDNNIVRINITGAQHVLENEVVVGMTEETLYRKVGYPSDYRAGQLRYIEGGSPEQGMTVRMQNGRVQSITVGNI